VATLCVIRRWGGHGGPPLQLFATFPIDLYILPPELVSSPIFLYSSVDGFRVRRD
jgi:hypothetical protein